MNLRIPALHCTGLDWTGLDCTTGEIDSPVLPVCCLALSSPATVVLMAAYQYIVVSLCLTLSLLPVVGG